MPRQPPQKERDAMRVVIQEDYRKMCKWAADYIAARIKAHGEDRPFVLGLPTGSSPIGVYQELVRQNRAGELSFANVVTFWACPRSMTRATGTSCTTTFSTISQT